MNARFCHFSDSSSTWGVATIALTGNSSCYCALILLKLRLLADFWPFVTTWAKCLCKLCTRRQKRTWTEIVFRPRQLCSPCPKLQQVLLCLPKEGRTTGLGACPWLPQPRRSGIRERQDRSTNTCPSSVMHWLTTRWPLGHFHSCSLYAQEVIDLGVFRSKVTRVHQ